MITIRPVVLGIDGTQDAPVRVAVDEARRRGAPLRVIHCSAMPFEEIELYVSETAYREMLLEGQQILDRARGLIEQLDGRLAVEYLLSSAAPIDRLMDESASAQLLVIGIEDLPWYDRLLGGAAAGYLAQHASCAVIAVPQADGAGGPHEGVFAAIDGSSAARPMLRLAFDVAQERGCAVHALRVVPVGVGDGLVDSARAGLSEVMAGWRELYPDVQITQQVVAGDPDDIWRELASRAELVLVGRSRRHGLRRSITAGVLRHATCPVGVVPIDDHDA